LKALDDADAVLYVLDASRGPGPEEDAIVQKLLSKDAAVEQKLLVALNKTELQGAKIAETGAYIARMFPHLPEGRVFQISALQKQGLEPLLVCLFSLAPDGEAFYPADYYTDQELPFRNAEVIRGEAIRRVREELPHALYVDVADTELRPDGNGGQKLWVRAFLVCERESQKGMLVGKGGAMVKAIRLASLEKLNVIFDWKVQLDLRIKADPHWRHNDALLSRLIH
jgi:GTP-binding protein Era